MKSKGMYAALLSPDDIIKYNFDVVSGQFNIFSDQKVVLTQHIFERKKLEVFYRVSLDRRSG